MLRKQHIQDAISASGKSCRQIAREVNLDKRRILLELKKIIKGNYNARERLASINLLLKITGAYSPDKTEVDINFNEKDKINITNMTPDEIIRLSYEISAKM